MSRNSWKWPKTCAARLPGSDQGAPGSGQKREHRIPDEFVLSFTPMTCIRLFVYGSLCKGKLHHGELCDSLFLGSSVTQPGYRLVERGAYPALVPGEQAINGELYAVDTALVSKLDAFEGDGYRRKPVRLADATEAEAYFQADSVRE
jgi:gamma-glutamylcyclotransferase (GGCT)/AIG2-like uncharacterized protein YtfP